MTEKPVALPSQQPVKRLCIICHERPAELPDRDSMSRTKKVCRECHSDRLRRDLKAIAQQSAELAANTTTRTLGGVQDHRDAAQIVGGEPLALLSPKQDMTKVPHAYSTNGAFRDPCCAICGGEWGDNVHSTADGERIEYERI